MKILASLESFEYVPRSVSRSADRYKAIIEEHWFSYLLFLPTVLFLFSLIGLPFLRGIWMSFHEWPILDDPSWIGLGNYTYLIGWEPFLVSLKATVVFATTTAIQLGLALIASLVIFHQKRFKNVLNSVFLLPYTMPPVVTGAVWLFILHPDLGPVFTFLTKMTSILDAPIYWQIDGSFAMATIIGVMAWTFWPFMFLIILASLENIPTEHYETAKVYGAGRIQTFLRVTLPQLKSAILVAVSIRIVWNLTKISQPLQLTGGGPGYETSILAVLLYRFGWIRGSMGLAFAVGIVLFVVTLGFVILFIREFQRGAEVRG